ncbi:hypothetical protein [Duganella sp. Root198D2]|jgi:hypothetical protein|uniref:hypothetical protein n=1 Tax=Duganella sp. Root198D2 TaxID=1736489 RepID=UPI00070F0BF5|nr:hypothetical protein [Duganella sp. Root198D2]KRB98281.1 hypothetical protein ASE26_25565 [Duganella sp. Root198D2]
MKQEFFDPDLVHDRDSFLQFAQWLIDDRHEADDVERADPERYKWGGAHGWQNSSIASFLEGAIAGADAQRDWAVGSGPSWKDLAVFLYLGKIYE